MSCNHDLDKYAKGRHKQDDSLAILQRLLKSGYDKCVWLLHETHPKFDICDSYNGKIFDIEKLINENRYNAPIFSLSHPNCRCILQCYSSNNDKTHIFVDWKGTSEEGRTIDKTNPVERKQDFLNLYQDYRTKFDAIKMNPYLTGTFGDPELGIYSFDIQINPNVYDINNQREIEDEILEIILNQADKYHIKVDRANPSGNHFIVQTDKPLNIYDFTQEELRKVDLRFKKRRMTLEQVIADLDNLEDWLVFTQDEIHKRLIELETEYQGIANPWKDTQSKKAGKQVGTLYHFTRIENLSGILETDTLDPKERWGNWVSFTRNKNLLKTEPYRGIGKGVLLVIDGDKLSNNYKIEPYNDYPKGQPKPFEDTNLPRNHPAVDEDEERVKGVITNISSYIKEIILDKDYIDKNYGTDEIVQEGIDKAIELAKQKGIPVRYDKYVKLSLKKQAGIWIDPNNKIINLGRFENGESHFQWAIKNIFPDVEEKNQLKEFNKLFSKGWIRISDDFISGNNFVKDGKGHLGITCSRFRLPQVENWLIENLDLVKKQKYVTIDDGDGPATFYNFSYQDFIDSGMQLSKLKKTARWGTEEKGLWVSPTNEIFDIERDKSGEKNYNHNSWMIINYHLTKNDALLEGWIRISMADREIAFTILNASLLGRVENLILDNNWYKNNYYIDIGGGAFDVLSFTLEDLKDSGFNLKKLFNLKNLTNSWNLPSAKDRQVYLGKKKAQFEDLLSNDKVEWFLECRELPESELSYVRELQKIDKDTLISHMHNFFLNNKENSLRELKRSLVEYKAEDKTELVKLYSIVLDFCEKYGEDASNHLVRLVEELPRTVTSLNKQAQPHAETKSHSFIDLEVEKIDLKDRQQYLNDFIYKNVPIKGVYFKDLINEDKERLKYYFTKLPKTSGKQVGTLYHFTSISGAIEILQSDKMLPTIVGDKEDRTVEAYVSFTRNKNMMATNLERGLGGIDVMLVIDGDKLSNNYKISPYSQYGDIAQEKDKEDRRKGKSYEPSENIPLHKHPEWDESEERVPGIINNISKYIELIVIDEQRADELRIDATWYIETLIKEAKLKNIEVDFQKTLNYN